MGRTAEATETWEGRRLSFDYDVLKWRATRMFEVAYATDENNALAAVNTQFNVDRGSSHDLCGTLLCSNVEASKTAVNMYRVKAEYTVDTGGRPGAVSADPLKQPPKISWNPAINSAPLEKTPSGVLIATPAGQPFAEPVEAEVRTMVLTVERTQPYYDPAQAMYLMGTINSDNFIIPGKGFNTAVAPGQCRCTSVTPEGSYTRDAYFVKVRWRFEIRPDQSPRFSTQRQFSDAWDIIKVAKGTVGWYQDPSKGPTLGRIVRAGQDSLDEPVLLDQVGIPLDGKNGAMFKIYPSYTIIANPTPMQESSDFIWEQISAPTSPTGTAWAMHYRRFKPIKYSSLL